MITDVYAHMLDEERKVNAQKFGATFYARNSANSLKVKPPEHTNSDLTNLILALEQSPEQADCHVDKSFERKCC